MLDGRDVHQIVVLLRWIIAQPQDDLANARGIDPDAGLAPCDIVALHGTAELRTQCVDARVHLAAAMRQTARCHRIGRVTRKCGARQHDAHGADRV